MPNGGSDHCGNCRHNRVNIGREATRAEKFTRGFCTVREVELRAPASTYCANHYVPFTAPIGPMYAECCEHDRLPYHDGVRPGSANATRCEVCGGASPPQALGVELEQGPGPALQFCGPAHYRRWWKQAHPGEALKWDHDAQAG